MDQARLLAVQRWWLLSHAPEHPMRNSLGRISSLSNGTGNFISRIALFAQVDVKAMAS
jgi:hypothetical protein